MDGKLWIFLCVHAIHLNGVMTTFILLMAETHVPRTQAISRWGMETPSRGCQGAWLIFLPGRLNSFKFRGCSYTTITPSSITLIKSNGPSTYTVYCLLSTHHTLSSDALSGSLKRKVPHPSPSRSSGLSSFPTGHGRRSLDTA